MSRPIPLETAQKCPIRGGQECRTSGAVKAAQSIVDYFGHPFAPKGGLSPLDKLTNTAHRTYMASTAVIKNTDFTLVTEFAQPDTKKRLSLGEALLGSGAFNIYRNPLGQLFLDPVKTIPASEAWLFENPAALASVKQGLKESAEGKRIYRGSFAKHAKD